MKKVLLMLLCAATVALVSCDKGNKNEPTNTTPTTTEVTEADFILKFYTSDSLLKYTNFSIKDEKDTMLDCSNYTVSKPDTAKVDAADWDKISFALGVMTEPNSLTVDNIKIITVKVHLTKGHSHSFRITYTPNGVAAQSDVLDTVLGGSAQQENKIPGDYYSQAYAHAGVDMTKFDQFVNVINKSNDFVMHFTF